MGAAYRSPVVPTGAAEALTAGELRRDQTIGLAAEQKQKSPFPRPLWRLSGSAAPPLAATRAPRRAPTGGYGSAAPPLAATRAPRRAPTGGYGGDAPLLAVPCGAAPPPA
ncbi:MAG: hypothetical protein M0013_04135, partial [Actinomycetota bacterium]|nr:hypothetical protein [Actinomycetota bacterium]